MEVIDIAIDARRVRPGSLFFCVRGAGVDGHDWVDLAVANGAVGIVAEREVEAAVPVTVVPDARVALAEASDDFWGRPTESLQVAGVTGTSGKTTTAYLIRSILDAAGRRPALLSTVETRIGEVSTPPESWTPAAFGYQRAFRRMLDAGHLSCAIEAMSYDSELMRLHRVRFAALVFTNLGHDHLDHHETMERYFAAKRRLFTDGDPPGAANVDDPYGRRLAAELPVLTFGAHTPADIAPERVERSRDGARIHVDGLELRTPLLGRHNVSNVLAAVAAARLLGLADDAIVDGVAGLTGIPGRMERIDAGQRFAVYVDYAHKPEALEAVLRTARGLADGRVICVFGCGGDCYRGKRPMMGGIAAALADVVILTTDDPRDEDPQRIVDEIAAGGAPDAVELDRRRAIGRALEAARAGDVVVVAGRGHETEQALANGRTRPFDDRAVVRELLARS